MARSRRKRDDPRRNVTDEDLELFCKLEQVLDEGQSGVDSLLREHEEAERSRLARDFPDSFVDAGCEQAAADVSAGEIADYRRAISELHGKLAYVSRKQEEVDHAARGVASERAALERERARVERDKVIATGDLANEELLDTRRKYRELKRRYKEEKEQWQQERELLLEKIAAQNLPIPPKSPEKVVRHPAKKPAPKKSPGVALHRDYPLDFKFDPGPLLREEAKPDGRKLLRYRNGILATVFKNGTRKMKVGQLCYVFYTNGDIAIEFEDGARGYRYAETKTIELNLPDESTFIEFPDGQREQHLTNGDKVVRYPGGQIKTFHPNGEFEIRDPSGRIERYANGQLQFAFGESDRLTV
jgi:hypothetical protein